MTTSISNKALLIAAILATGTIATSAAALSPGDYRVDGLQQICIKSDGTWYGESAGPWSGNWKAGSTAEEILIFGGSSAGYYNDSMVVRHGSLQWTEWADDLSYGTFNAGPFVRTGAICGPPATSIVPGQSPAMK